MSATAKTRKPTRPAKKTSNKSTSSQDYNKACTLNADVAVDRMDEVVTSMGRVKHLGDAHNLYLIVSYKNSDWVMVDPETLSVVCSADNKLQDSDICRSLFNFRA